MTKTGKSSLLKKAAIKRYGLVILLLISGGGGIFSEESASHKPAKAVVYGKNLPFIMPRQKIGFRLFDSAALTFPRAIKSAKPFTVPKISFSIMGKGALKIAELAGFLHRNNPSISLRKAKKIARIYKEEARAEGVNCDIAFSQMCLETGFLRYGGTVLPGQNNFCGLGVLNKKTKGFSFRDFRLGIRAHIQHLKAYASHQKLHHKLIDPRFRFVKRGSIQNVDDLAGKWASDKDYGKKIRYLLNRMYQTKV
jgi:hypothetical protein